MNNLSTIHHSLQNVSKNNMHVLVVEDDPINQAVLVKQLEKLGYITHTANDGQQALDWLELNDTRTDMIVLDRIMPVMDGIEFMHRIKAHPTWRYIPVIMQTAADRAEEIHEGIKAGVLYYLTKPVSNEMLDVTIKSARAQLLLNKALMQEMEQFELSFAHLDKIECSFRTLEEAERLSSFLAQCYPEPRRVVTGIMELFINAIEHGNLQMNYEEKTRLVAENKWHLEIIRRLEMPEYLNKKINVIFSNDGKGIYKLEIEDQGKGFDWQQFLYVDPSRAFDNHGRGIAMANLLSFDQINYNAKGNKVTALINKEENYAQAI